MTGETSLRIVICAISLIALFTDLRSRRIYNWLTFPAIAVGLLWAFWSRGAPGLLDSFLAVAIAFGVFAWMFAIGIMGAGDVKLLMAYGALGGITYTLDVAVLSIFVGGALAVGILLARRQFGDFFMRMQLVLIAQRPTLDQKLKMPFGVALAVAAVWTLFANPLAQWGFRPWA